MPLLRKSKKHEQLALSNPNLSAWTREPQQRDQTEYHNLHELSESDLLSGLPYQSVMDRNQFMGLPHGVMGQKRDKKKKKDKKSKQDPLISVPYPQGRDGVVLGFTQNFPVEHLATMAVEGKLNKISPVESVRKLKSVLEQHHVWKHNVFLVITDTEIIIKDVSTKEEIMVMPLAYVVTCNHIQDPATRHNVLMIGTQGPGHQRPQLHYFQCARTPAQNISSQISHAVAQYKQTHRHDYKRLIKGEQQHRAASPMMSRDMIDDNWVFGEQYSSQQSPASPLSPLSLTPPHNQFAQRDITNSPALANTTHQQLPLPIASPQYSAMAAAPANQQRFFPEQTDGSSTPGITRRTGQAVSKVANEYASTVLSSQNPKVNERGDDIRMTMKASFIQHDVDLLNHVIDDLELFVKLLYTKSTARRELDKRMRRSKRKKNDAEYVTLMRKAQPPSDADFIQIYQKCKFGINLIAKLGHHLSNPSAETLLDGVFVYMREFVKRNRSSHLASSVQIPLLTKQAIDLMLRSLPPRNSLLWRELGANWRVPQEQWPATSPLQEYEIIFTDGCTQTNLHNLSDRPALIPSLNTLPREKRGKDYSDAYDRKASSSQNNLLRINPAVEHAIATRIGKINTGSVPANLHTMGESQFRASPVLRQKATLAKTAKVLFSYAASTLDEITVYRGEKVEVLDDSKKWWQVRNKMGNQGYVPSNLLEVQHQSPMEQTDGVLNMSGRLVPAPPLAAPPPPPTMPPPPPPSELRPDRETLLGNYPHPGSSHRLIQQSSSPQMSMASPASSVPVGFPAPPPGVPPPPPPTSTTALPPPPPGPPLPPGVPAPPGPPLPAGVPAPPGPPLPAGVPPPPPPPPGPPLPAGVPPPPPPPPVAAPQQTQTLGEMIAAHRNKLNKDKPKIPSSVKTDNSSFNLIEELKNRRNHQLRKTTTKISLEVANAKENKEPETELQLKLKSRQGQESSTDSAILAWDADRPDIESWLCAQGFQKCLERLNAKSGKMLYTMSRDELRDSCGFGEGTRLFSHLQRDKPKAKEAAGVSNVSEFQAVMKSRRTWVEDTKTQPKDNKSRRNDNDDSEDDYPPEMPAWKKELLMKKKSSGHYYDKDGRKVVRDEGRDDNDDGKRGGRGRRKDNKEDKKGRKGDKKDDKKGSKKTSSSDQQKKDTGKSKKTGSSNKRHPTNIDDFDEDEYSDSDSDSETDDSESEENKMSSSEAARILGAKWALGDNEDSIEDLEERIRVQQQEIQIELTNLTVMQRKFGMKALPSLQQKVLQSDLQKLQVIQTRLKENPGVHELQMLLVGQQMILCEHLKDIQQSFGHRKSASDDTLAGLINQPASNNHLINQPVSNTHLQPSGLSASGLYNPMVGQPHINEIAILAAAEQARQLNQQQQMAQQILAQRRQQQQLLAAAQLSAAGLGGLGMPSYNPLAPLL